MVGASEPGTRPEIPAEAPRELRRSVFGLIHRLRRNRFRGLGQSVRSRGRSRCAALTTIFRHPVGCGRPDADAGVHASGQVAHR